MTAISPASGTTAGGTSVTITGTNLTDATAVTIGGVSVTSFTVVNATTITTTTPAGTAGTASVVVTTPGGNNAPNTLYTYLGVTIVVSPGTDINATEGLTTTRQFTASGGLAPYIYSTASTLPPGLLLTSGGLLSGRPTANSAGSYNVTISAEDDNGSFGFVSFTITVGARPDPTTDASVIGIQNSQLAASKRFSGMQSDAALSRLEVSRQCTKNALKVTPQGMMAASDNSANKATDSYSLSNSGSMTSSPKAAQQNDEASCADWAVWGDAGISNGANGDNRYKFNMPSVTVGIDFRANPSLVVGLALGYGEDDNEINNGLAQSDSRFYSTMVYAGFEMTDSLFLDVIAGYSDGHFNTKRDIVEENLSLKASRNGNQFFSKVRLSGVQEINGFRLMPFVSVEYGDGSLKSYRESGDNLLALAYEKANFDYTTASAGMKLSYAIKTETGVFEPSIRFQHRYTNDSSVNQTLYYADLPENKYNLRTDPFSRNQSTVDFGLTLRTKGGVSAGAVIGISSGSQSLVERSGNINVSVPF